MSEVARCPFCGDEPLVRYRGGAWGANCAGNMPSHLIWTYGETEAEAVGAWNAAFNALGKRPSTNPGDKPWTLMKSSGC